MSEQAPQVPKTLRRRRILVGLLVVVTCLMVLATTVETWAHRTLLNTDSWVETVAPLGTNPAVTSALAEQVTDRIVSTLDLERRAREALDEAAPRASFLAAPIANAVDGFVREKVLEYFGSPAWGKLWTDANRFAHERLVTVLRGREGTNLTVENGEVTLNLLPLITAVLQRIQDRAEGLLGDDVSLPSITGTEQVSQAISALSTALHRELPPDYGQIVVFRSDKLEAAQRAVRLFDRFNYFLILVSLVLIGVSVWLSVNRRRTAVQLAIGVIMGVLIARLVIKQITASVLTSLASGNRDAVGAVLDAMFRSLRSFTTWLLVIAIIAAVASFLAGKPAWIRAARAQAAKAYGSGKDLAASDRPSTRWIREHADGLMTAGPLVALIALFVIGVSWATVITLGALLVLYELGLRRLASVPEQTAASPAP